MRGYHEELTQERIAAIIEDLCKPDMRIIDIATKYGHGKRTIMKIRDENGIMRPRTLGYGKKAPKMTQERKEAIAEDLRRGMLTVDILKKHHVSYQSLANIQQEYGLFRKKAKREEADAVDWSIYGPKWDRTRIIVLKAMEPKKERHWLWS